MIIIIENTDNIKNSDKYTSKEYFEIYRGLKYKKTALRILIGM